MMCDSHYNVTDCVVRVSSSCQHPLKWRPSLPKDVGIVMLVQEICLGGWTLHLGATEGTAPKLLTDQEIPFTQ